LQVRLHDVHVVLRGGLLRGFACCARSRVEILAFSPYSK
jgi:hypothetical protein